MTVPAITIPAFRGDRPLSLEEILRVLGAGVQSADWQVSAVEVAPGASADRLHAASDQGTPLTGDELVALAPGTQVIDGEFEARRGSATEPWVLLRAVDGTSWDVVTDDLTVIQGFEREFPDATPLP